MTEEMWLSSNDLRVFLDYLYAKQGPKNRKLQLLGCGLCRRQERHLRRSDGMPHLLNRMELFADGELGRDELRATRKHVQSRSGATWNFGYEREMPTSALGYAVLELAAWFIIDPERAFEPFYSYEHEGDMPNEWHDGEQFPYPHRIARIVADSIDSDVETAEGWSFEREQQLLVVRDIFGNPFRPITIDPRWLTSIVLDLSRTIYAERAFEKMPILADALMDAGCDCDEIINHCRGAGPHVRGCWVVDLLLGKS